MSMMAEELFVSRASPVEVQNFHSVHGSSVQLSENGLSAFRLRPSHEFNQGLVFSSQPLKEEQVFEVRIDRKVHSWTGSIQIGITTQDPSTFHPIPPPNALDIVNKSWVLSGCNVFENGKIIVEDYGSNLDDLNEGDRVGVLRTSEGDLVFCINSFAQGVAVSGIPSPVFAVVDLYGKCVQVSVVNHPEIPLQPRPLIALNSMIGTELNQQEESCSTVSTPSAALQDRLRFHHRCGTMVKLSAGQRTGERRKPLDEFNNGVVMTQRPLLSDELFEIRIDSQVDKWSGSIEVGITTHNPANLDFPSTMTNLRSGTIMMSGCGILTNGKGTRREYGQCNLDELGEGDRIGLIRKANGDLHFYVNSRDQGVAASNVPHPVWGVVDLYGRTVKVSLIDREDIIKTATNQLDETTPVNDRLQFHPRCGLHAAVLNGGITGHRPNAQSDFNHGVLLTNRTLMPDELFEVVLDKVVLKWAGSIEIGVTTQRPEDLDFPATMTNVRTGTWMMTGNGVMHNGLTVLDEYGTSLDRLGTGDRVGVVRRSNGVLHFFVNGEDQGPSVGHIPECVYGVVDLYGQAAQVSIVTQTSSTPLTDSSTYPSYLYPAPSHLLAPLVSPTSLADSTYALPSSSSVSSASSTLIHTDLRFHKLHGRNTTLTNNGLTASRPNALSEFNDSICITSRPLRPGEVFEVVIEKLVERWSGSLELGVTSIHPENLDFPSTMTDITYGTWMLSGSSVMQDGTITRNGYPLDLDALQEGNRVGLLRHADGSLHYYLNDQDQGAACCNVPQDLYAVIDLYGQCAQVSLVHRPLQACGIPQDQRNLRTSLLDSTPSDLHSGNQYRHLHHLSPYCGRAITLSEDLRTARRKDKDFEHGLVFSSTPLFPDESFDFSIEALSQSWAGSLAVGLTDFHPQEGSPIPSSLRGLDSAWYISDTNVVQTGGQIVATCLPMEHLSVGDVVSVRRTAESTLRFAINGCDLAICLRNIPTNGIYVVIDLHGMVQAVSVKSTRKSGSFPESLATTPALNPIGPANGSLPLSLSQLALREAMQGIQSALSSRFGSAFCHQQRFHDHHGRNVVLKNNALAAFRTASYNQGLVYSKEPLLPGSCFQVRIEQLDDRWTGSLMIGVTGIPPDKIPSTPPTSALLLKRPSWVVSGHFLYQNSRRIRSDLKFNLNELRVGQSVGVHLSQSGHFHVLVDGLDYGSLGWVGTGDSLFAVFDLYGQTTEVSTISSRSTSTTTSTPTVQPTLNEEKALRETSNTEKSLAENRRHVQRSCRYKANCERFIQLMGLPDAYLEKEKSVCGCEHCFRDLESPLNKINEEIKGWCRWTVKNRRPIDKNDFPGINEKSQTAYHGTRPSVVRRIIDEGHLLPPDLNIWQRTRITHRRSIGKDEESNGQLLFSPSLHATSLAPISELYDPVLKKNLRGQVVLQVLVQPGSYKVRRATSPLNGPGPISVGSLPCNPESGQQQLFNTVETVSTTDEQAVLWYTKERGAATVHALLIKLEETDLASN